MEQNRIEWVVSAEDHAELEKRYDKWAKDYDSDLERDYGWLGPQKTAEVTARHVSREARVLDAGAGTGMAGEALSKLGYRNLVAMDLSQGMLEEARRKRVYWELHRMRMGDPLDFASDSFDAVVCVGALLSGHAPASSLDELVRITRPGGHVIFTLRNIHEGEGFQEKQAALELEGRWKLVEAAEEFQSLPKGEPDVYHQIWVYRGIC